MAPSITNQSSKDPEGRAVCGGGTIPVWASILLACSLAIGVTSESLAQGQSGPRSSRSRQEPDSPEPVAAPQVASPDADYALSSIRSRSATPTDPNESNIDINNVLARRLWQSRIMAPDPNEDAEIRSDLHALIRQVRSVSFTDPTNDMAYAAPPQPDNPADTSAQNTVPSAKVEQVPPATVAATPTSQSPAALPANVLNQLEEMVRNPNQVHDPLEMAELLFLSGRTAEAAVFYEKALALIPADDLASSEDRAWILFQLGNCLRETDMSKARDTYMKLISQYPSSPWTELAKAYGRFINWYQTAKPDQLMPTEP